MSSFFKQLIDIGEEDKTAKSGGSEEELSRMSTDQLHQMIRSLRQQLTDSNTEFENLRVDSQGLRSEFDAYKQKVESWQRQIREARANDKKLIDQLRAAGTTGGTDEVFVKNMNDTIAQYKESLREANDNVAKAYKRQREAEEQRAAVEASKKKEIDELWAKLESFKERMKKGEADFQPGGSGGHGDAGTPSPITDRLRERIAQAESTIQSLKGRNKALEEEVTSLREVISTTSSTTSRGGDGADGGEGEQLSSGASDTIRGLQVDLAAARSQISTFQAALEQERDTVAQLRTTEASLREDVRRAEATAHRRIEDLEWEGVEAEKKLAEVRLQLDAANARCVTLENRLETKEVERGLQEKELRRTIRDLQDELALDKQKLTDATREFQEKESALHNEVSRAVSQAARTSELVGEAEQLNQRHNELMETQRRKHEEHLMVLERQLREADAIRHRLEAVVSESKEEHRHREDVLDSLRQELDSMSMRMTDLEAQNVHHLRTLNAREDELVARERERHQLRQQLIDAEDSVSKLKSKYLQVEELKIDHARQIEKLESRHAELSLAKSKLETESETMRRSMKALQKQLEGLETRAGELEKELVEERRLHSEMAKRVEMMPTSHLKGRDGEVPSATLGVGVGSATAGQNGGAVPDTFSPATSIQPVVSRQVTDPVIAASSAYTHSRAKGVTRYQPHLQFPGERGEGVMLSTTLKRITWGQWRIIIGAVVFFLVIVSLINSSSIVPAGAQTGVETLSVLREKYDQALMSLTSCREQMAACKK